MSILAAKSANQISPERMFRQERDEILAGLRQHPKRISPKYFYDQRGSELFDEICDLPEYYPTRTEHRIMEDNLPEISELVGPGAAVIEFGAGSNAKARQLLRSLSEPVAYVPVEISGEYLLEQCEELTEEFPGLSVKPVVADFMKPFDLPVHPRMPRRNLVFFPGSTIGNFTHREARDLLEVMKEEAKPDGALLIGVDLVKDTEVVTAAYNDNRGVTAQFNLNVLSHINEALGADFRPECFRHEAKYDAEHDRIEMRLVATCSHTAGIAGESIRFTKDEHIITEYSHKYSVDGFRELSRSVGLEHLAVWTDDDELFSVHFLTAPS